MVRISWGLSLCWLLASATALPADEVQTKLVRFKSDSGVTSSLAEVLVAYDEGSLLLLTPDGQLRTLSSEEIESAVASEDAMVPLTAELAGKALAQEMGPGFLVYHTRHYVLVYNTSEIYVKWVGKLFERLHLTFYNYWRARGIRLDPPRFPLLAIVFSDKASYLAYAQRELGDSATAMLGYYNLKTNRMATFDLTGVDGMIPAGMQVPTQAMINQILSRPEAERTVATIVHEAVHQLSFNSGLQVRLADNPLWICEGMAMFFEAPDSGSAQGAQKIGNINHHNFQLFAQNLNNRPTDSLTTLVTDDARFREAATASQAYPESWALTYFLFKSKTKEVSGYLKELQELPPLGEFSARQRLDVFKKHFGEDLVKLDEDFISFMRRLW